MIEPPKQRPPSQKPQPEPLAADELSWICPESALPFESTAEIEAIAGVVGQSYALESLRFGIETRAPGQNVYIRGLSGTGRMTMVKRLLEELKPVCTTRQDRCYVHNFSAPERPRLISLPPGKARNFKKAMRGLADFVSTDLLEALKSEPIASRSTAIQNATNERIQEETAPVEEELKQAGMALVTLQGPVTQTAIFPLVQGNPIPPEKFEELVRKGDVPEADFERYKERLPEFRKKIEKLTQEVSRVFKSGTEELRDFIQSEARQLLRNYTADLEQSFPTESVKTFIEEVVEDVLENRLGGGEDLPDAHYVYGVNVLVEHRGGDDCATIVETHPSLSNLLGSVEPEFLPTGATLADYTRIRAGSLLRADGGYLILDAADLLTEPGAWKVLTRTLRSGKLEIIPPELSFPFARQNIQPEPIPVNVRVILVGDSTTYYLLDRHDLDFPNLFKVLADFDSTIANDAQGIGQYAGVLARIASEEGLPPFERGAVGRLAEHGARIASNRGKLTTRFARVADLAREAAFLTRRDGRSVVTRDDVSLAIRRTKERASLPSRRFQEFLKGGTIRIESQGQEIGQINGLAVISAGPLTYGFPARITATIGPGNAGIIDIEGRASMSGAIHTKGFQILGGLLRRLLPTDHPLAFSASLAFEQSYGGIDGDSASGAEIVCLISALTEVPIRQDLAMTGAIDQHGHLQAIGGVNEKIEGFFDACQTLGFTGTQGVVIPQANAQDLMLRSDVIESAREGKFAVYAVETIREALEIFSGMPAGELGDDGEYPEGTLLHLAQNQAHEYWKITGRNPYADVSPLAQRGLEPPPKPEREPGSA